MTYTIEQDIPIPARHSGTNPPSIYPFAEMKVGESFLIPASNGERPRLQSGAALEFRRWQKAGASKKLRITTRQVWDGVRVWRTK